MTKQVYDLPKELAFPILDQCCTLSLRLVSRGFRDLVDDYLLRKMQEFESVTPRLVNKKIAEFIRQGRPPIQIFRTFLKCIPQFNADAVISTLRMPRRIVWDSIDNEINYSDGHLNHIPKYFLTRWDHIVKIDLSYNSLKKLPSNFQQFSDSLEELDISHNEIVRLTLIDFDRLRILNASYNRINFLQLSTCKNIQHVNLKKNRIGYVRPFTLNSWNCVSINLSHNPITEVQWFNIKASNFDHTPFKRRALQSRYHTILETFFLLSLFFKIYRVIYRRKHPLL